MQLLKSWLQYVSSHLNLPGGGQTTGPLAAFGALSPLPGWAPGMGLFPGILDRRVGTAGLSRATPRGLMDRKWVFPTEGPLLSSPV